MINSHKVTRHACTSSWLPLAHSKHHTYHQVTVMNKQQKKQRLSTTHIYIHISCKCDTNRAGHFTLDAHASRPVACLWFACRHTSTNINIQVLCDKHHNYTNLYENRCHHGIMSKFVFRCETMITSGQNFAHDTTAQLPLNVQIYGLIGP